MVENLTLYGRVMCNWTGCPEIMVKLCRRHQCKMEHSSLFALLIKNSTFKGLIQCWAVNSICGSLVSSIEVEAESSCSGVIFYFSSLFHYLVFTGTSFDHVVWCQGWIFKHRAVTLSTCWGLVCLMGQWFYGSKLPVVDRIHPQSNTSLLQLWRTRPLETQNLETAMYDLNWV